MPVTSALTSSPTWGPCDVPVVNAVCGVPGQLAHGIFDTIASEFANAATALLTALLRVIDTTTSVNVTADWFTANYRTITKVGLSALLVLLFIQLLSSAVQRKTGGLARAVVGTGTAVLATAALLTVTEVALVVTDDISRWVAGAGNDPTRQLLHKLFPLVALPSTGGAMLLIGSLLVIVAAFVLWTVLLFRKIAIYLVVVFGPVAFAGQAWSGSRGWAKRLLHVLAALILCKVAIVTVFVIGASAAAHGNDLSSFLAGVILLGIACFAPWLTFRFLHFVDLAVVHDHYRLLRDSPAGSPVRTSMSALERGQRLASWAVPGIAGAGSAAGQATRASTPRSPADRAGSATSATTPRRSGTQSSATQPGTDLSTTGSQSDAPEHGRGTPSSWAPGHPTTPPTGRPEPPTSRPAPGDSPDRQ